MTCAADRERIGPAHRSRCRIGRYRGNRQAPAGEQNAPLSRLPLERESVCGACKEGRLNSCETLFYTVGKGVPPGTEFKGMGEEAKQRIRRSTGIRSQPQTKAATVCRHYP